MDKLQVNSNSSLVQLMQSRPLLAIINEDYPKIRNVSNIEENDGLINYLIVLMNIKTSSQVEKQDLEIQMIVALDFIKFIYASEFIG